MGFASTHVGSAHLLQRFLDAPPCLTLLLIASHFKRLGPLGRLGYRFGTVGVPKFPRNRLDLYSPHLSAPLNGNLRESWLIPFRPLHQRGQEVQRPNPATAK